MPANDQAQGRRAPSVDMEAGRAPGVPWGVQLGDNMPDICSMRRMFRAIGEAAISVNIIGQQQDVSAERERKINHAVGN